MKEKKEFDTIEKFDIEPIITTIADNELLFIGKDIYLTEFDNEDEMIVKKCGEHLKSIIPQIITDEQIKHNRIWLIKYLYNLCGHKNISNIFYFRNYKDIMDEIFNCVNNENITKHILSCSYYENCLNHLYNWIVLYFDGLLGCSFNTKEKQYYLTIKLKLIAKNRKIYNKVKISFYLGGLVRYSSFGYCFKPQGLSKVLSNYKSIFNNMMENTKEKVYKETGLIKAIDRSADWTWSRSINKSFKSVDELVVFIQKRYLIEDVISSIKIHFDRYTGNNDTNTFDMIRVDLPLAQKFDKKEQLIQWIKDNKELIDEFVLYSIEDRSKFKSYGVPINILQLTNLVLSVDNVLLYTFEIKKPTIPEE